MPPANGAREARSGGPRSPYNVALPRERKRPVPPEPGAGSAPRHDFRIARAAIDHHLHGARLDQIEGVALVALENDRRTGRKRNLFHLAEHFGDILARQRRKNRNAADSLGDRIHGRPY